jgi:Uma2 family endonuclease
MSTAALPPTLTVEQLDALPEDGKERELIRGTLREREMTKRNRRHSRIEIRIGRFLDIWLDGQPEPRGEVVGGEAGFRLRRDPDTAVGIDVAYVAAEVAARDPDAAYFDGPPTLAVEILSPSDKQEEIDEKILVYLESGVEVVWIVNPKLKTVTVYRPNAAPAIYVPGQELAGGAELPGFRLAVASLF